MRDWLGRIQEAVAEEIADAVATWRNGSRREAEAAKRFLESPQLAGIIKALQFGPMEVRVGGAASLGADWQNKPAQGASLVDGR